MSVSQDVVHHVDGGDRSCARLLILVRDVVVGLAEGDVIHLATTDPVAPIDLPVWCRMTGHTYLGPVQGAATPTYAVRITYAPVPTDPEHPWKAAR